MSARYPQRPNTTTNTVNSKSLANEKKLDFIKTTIQKMLSDYEGIYSQLEQTYDRADE